MAMPFFTPGDDPGSNFPDLLRRIGLDVGRRRRRREHCSSVPHATTCVAMRFADGVVMAGDRRATTGNLISHRGDGEGRPGRPLQRRRHRRRGRAGDGDDQAVPAAARALREGRGLGAQPRGQGQPAVDDGARQPPGGDAGHGRRADLRRLRPAPAHRSAVGLRRHRRPLRGAATTSPPARAACTPAPSSSSATDPSSSRDDAVDLACRALWEAADADSATGGPDALRGIYPIVATITADGLAARRRRRVWPTGFERASPAEVRDR